MNKSLRNALVILGLPVFLGLMAGLPIHYLLYGSVTDNRNEDPFRKPVLTEKVGADLMRLEDLYADPARTSDERLVLCEVMNDVLDGHLGAPAPDVMVRLPSRPCAK